MTGPLPGHSQGYKPVTRRIFPRGYCSELRIQIIMALPLIVTQTTQFLLGPVAIMFCGRLGTLQMDAASLANSLISVCGITIATGLSTACDTLFSQIYGSRHKEKLGIVLIRSMIFIPLCAMPSLAIQLNAENVLIALGQNAQVAKLTAEYLLVFMPGMLAYFLYLPLTKYLQCQNMILPPMIIGLISNAINIGLHIILVVHLELGIIGSAVSQVVAFVSSPIIILLYILIFKVYKKTWTGWSSESLLDWSQFFWLAIFGLLMICIDWWGYEIGFILAGVLGTTELAAHSIVFQIAQLAYMPGSGLAVSSNIRVGHFLGANDPEGAINCYRVSLSIIWLMYIAMSITIYSLRGILPLVFTNIPEVIAMASAALPWYSLVCLFEGPFEVCGGILRGSGRQNIGSCVITGSYIVGLSIAIPTMMITRTIQGLWKGLAVTVSSECLILCVIILRTNWIKQANKAQERVSVQMKTLTEDSDELLENSDDSLVTSKHRRQSVENCQDHPFIDQSDIHEHNPLMIDEDNKYNTACEVPPIVTPAVYIRTVLVVLAMLSVLLAGVICREWIPHPDVTDLFNITTNIIYIGTNGTSLIGDHYEH